LSNADGSPFLLAAVDGSGEEGAPPEIDPLQPRASHARRQRKFLVLTNLANR
jgi:hypothetical protein